MDKDISMSSRWVVQILGITATTVTSVSPQIVSVHTTNTVVTVSGQYLDQSKHSTQQICQFFLEYDIRENHFQTESLERSRHEKRNILFYRNKVGTKMILPHNVRTF